MYLLLVGLLLFRGCLGQQARTLIMYLLLVGLMLFRGCLGEQALEDLYGVHGGNRVTVCLHGRRARACAGAVWMDDWAVALERCVGTEDTAPASVWRAGVNCSDALSNKVNEISHNVVARYHQVHRAPDDVVLLHLDWPFFNTDPLDNRSITSDTVRKLKLWVGSINEHTTQAPYMKKPQILYYNRRYMDMYASPIKMFVATVILPSTTFMLFFLFVIFCTGSSKSKVQYKNLTNEKEESDSTNV